MIYANVLRHPDLSKGAICHYGNLLLYARQDGKCWPGQKRLADDMRVSVRQIHTYNKELEAAGLIETEQRPLGDGINQTNVYTITGLLDTACYQHSTRAMDRNKTSDRDRKNTSDEVEAVEVEAVIPPTPPTTGGGKEKKKGKAGTGTAGTSSFGDKRDPAQNRAGQGRDGKRPARKRAPRGGVTSPAGIEAIRSFEARTEGLDYTGWKVERVKMRLASIAQRWDFASEEDPPMKVRRQISPDAESCDEILRRLRKTLKQAATSAEVDALNAKKERGHDHPSHDSTPVQASTSHPDPNSVEAVVSADRAREAEEAALVKAYVKANPEKCAYGSF
jgi:hypothetical protein